MKSIFRGLVRIIKGFYLGPVILVFGLGIGLERLFVVPVLLILERIKGSDPERLQRVHRALFRVWLGLFRIGGLLKTLPPKGAPMVGACVVVANHPGLFDVIMLIRDIPRLSVLAKRSLGSSLGLNSICALAGYVLAPDTSDTAEAVDSMQRVRKLLSMGFKFMLFPEGTRAPKHGILPFKAGAFKIARMARVPIQPVVIHNNPPFLPHEDHWYYPPFKTSTVCLEYLDPVPAPQEGQERAVSAHVQRMIADRLGLACSSGKDLEEGNRP